MEDNLGVVRHIRIEKILSKQVKAQSARVGGKIANEKDKSSYGTMGFAFKDNDIKNKYYASTCYHVVKLQNHSWETYSNFPLDEVCHLDEGDSCAVSTQLQKGSRNSVLDIALTSISRLDTIHAGSYPKVLKSADINEDYANLRVKVLTNRGAFDGYIHDWKTEVDVYYDDDNPNPHRFVDFFSIRLDNSRDASTLASVTVGGDSGSAVVFGDEALGMVVGGSDKLTYAMKIRPIEKNFGITLLSYKSLTNKDT
jgi:hypothetical protein